MTEKQLLKDILHELEIIDKWYAFEPTININIEKDGHTIINNKEFIIQLDFSDLIKRIEKDVDYCMDGLDEKNKKLNERIKQQEELISEQAIQLDYLISENKHMRDVLNENEQLKSTNMEMEDYLGRLEERVKTLKEGILDCLFENESLGEFALKMRLVE